MAGRGARVRGRHEKPTARGARGRHEKGRARVLGGRRRATIGLLSLATAAWLAAQAAAGLAISTKTWPITGWGMFKYARDPVVPRLEVRTRDGRTVRVRPGDFGLTQNQFNRYLKRLVGSWDRPRPDAPRRLAHLVDVWNRTHAADPAVSARVVVERSSPSGTPPAGPRPVVTWSRR